MMLLLLVWLWCTLQFPDQRPAGEMSNGSCDLIPIEQTAAAPQRRLVLQTMVHAEVMKRQNNVFSMRNSTEYFAKMFCNWLEVTVVLWIEIAEIPRDQSEASTLLIVSISDFEVS